MEYEKTIDELSIEELKQLYKNIVFLSDQVRFNSVIYENLGLIFEKIKNIEDKLNKIIPNEKV